ncbi:hypothetical protein FRC09_010921, partial [Ceratobasidium sp. 395]
MAYSEINQPYTLRGATWRYFNILSGALGNPNHPRYNIFIEEALSLYFILQEQQHSISSFESTLFEFQDRYKDQVYAAQKAREKLRTNDKRKKKRNKAKESGLDVVGDIGVPLDNVVFLDATTGRSITREELFAQLPAPGTARDPDSIPAPATSNEFNGFVDAKRLNELGFRIYTHGTIYWFAKARDGYYHFVLGAAWRNDNDISETGHQHLDKFVKFADQSVKHSFKVEKNWAQNRGKQKHGEIFMSGWHTSMRADDSITAYAPRPSVRHASDLEGYLDMNRSLKDALDALVWGQNKLLAPNVADYTMNSLSSLGMPMAGSMGTDFE